MCVTVTNSRLYESWVKDQVVHFFELFNVNSSVHNCGCVVDGGNAMATI